MCKFCDKAVLDMDIQETDLPNLPYTLVRWACLIPGCRCKNTFLRDYGIAPYYYWPVKRVDMPKENRFKGGWVDSTWHWKLCFKHGAIYEKKGEEEGFKWLYHHGVRNTPEFLMSRFEVYNKKKK